MAGKKSGGNQLRVGNITDVSGKVNIAGGDIYEGYSPEQVSVLLTQITTTLRPKPFDGRCPYKGLNVFEEKDADLFFGREKLVEDLLNSVKQSRTVFVTGPSGSGKSSLVRAGLIHALKDGAISGSNAWLYETLKPGREPIKDLGLAFSRLKSPELADYFHTHTSETGILDKCAESVLSGEKDQRLVLFIDQFEEIFTQVNQEAERVKFLNMLAHAGTIENGRVIVLFAMRSDFISNCATYSGINDLLSREFRQIGAMQPEELVSAIALPAKQVGLPIEDELIARIINDMKGEPGALPLMQFALKDLFDSRQAQGGVIALTLEDYLQHGGIQKSLEHHADDSFAKLSEGEQQLARSIFSGLIEVGRGTQDTRRTALFDELIPANAHAQDVEAIVQKLADARLIITDEQAGMDTVTISHEKLIDAWPWLKKLVNENRDAIALQNEIANDAKEWEDHKRDPSYLYVGVRLAKAHEQLAAKKLALSGKAQEFVEAGHRRQRRTQILLVSSISGIILLLAVAVLVFSKQSSDNRRLAQQARLRELAAQAALLRDSHLQTSLLLGAEVFGRMNNPQTRGVLLDNLRGAPHLIQFLSGHSGVIYSVAFSPDGRILASGGADNTIILWDVATHQPVGPPLKGHSDLIMQIAFSPDGKTLASAGYDRNIILWDMQTHRPIGKPLTGHADTVYSLAFSPDGKMLASGSADHSIILWDMKTHEPLGQPLTGHAMRVNSVAFSPDGKTLASGSADTKILLWDIATHQPIGEPLSGHTSSIYSVLFSPDGETLASASDDRKIILWDAETHQPIGQPLTEHTSRVNSLAFDKEGTVLASASDDNTIILWDMKTHRPIEQPLKAHAGPIHSVAFSPDGTMLASGGDDNNVVLWRLVPQEPIGHSLQQDAGPIYSVAFSPDRKVLAAGSYNNVINLWNPETYQSLGRPLSGHSSRINAVAFSPDGRTLASGSADNTIILWDMETHQPSGEPLKGHTDWVTSVAFSPDGKILASGSLDRTIVLWDLATRQPIGEPLMGHSDLVTSVAFSPDGKTLASGSADKTIILWDTETHQPIGQPFKGHTNRIMSIAFSPDGKTLASGSDDKTLILWDVETHQPIGEPLMGHSDLVISVAFSPDGKTLASGSADKTVILWDTETHQPIGQPLKGHTEAIYSVAFRPDGKSLASAGADQQIIVWDLDSQTWMEQTCQQAGRNFTVAEWRQYFPNETYQKTCPQWPAEENVPKTAQ